MEKALENLTNEQLKARVVQLEEELALLKRSGQQSAPSCDQPDNDLLRLMIDNAPDLIWAKDLNDRYMFANQAICDRLLKCGNMAEAVGKTDLYFAQRERQAGHEHSFGEICVNSDIVVKETRQPGRFKEYGLVRGKQLVLDVYKAPIFNGIGVLLGTVGCGRDITHEDEIQDELNKASTAIRNIIKDVEPIAVQGYDEQRRVTLWNKASEELYGYTSEEAMGQKIEDLIIPQEMAATVISLHHRWIRFGEKIPPGKLVLKHKDGSDVHVYSSHTIQETGNGKEMFCIDIDLSTVKKAEEEKSRLVEQLEKAHRLEAIGNLAGGIAHDFNNILTAITGYAEIAKSDLERDHPAVDSINQLLMASTRAVELVKQILTFSRNNQTEIRPVRIDLIAKEAMEMMRSSLPSTIEIRLNFEAGLAMVMSDPIRIHRVIVNLCTNAFHAMRNQRGRIEVGLNNCVVTAGMLPGGWSVDPGRFVRLSVRDDGVGMSQATINQIFEPYFTTKERGEGTGLGLAMVHGIVSGCKGFIEVRSEKGAGSLFNIYFPSADQKDLPEKDSLSATTLPTGDERILVVDDESSVCDVTSSILRKLGYTVQACTDSAEAFELFYSKPYEYDLVISDQTMPHLTGIELAFSVLKIRPELPFILCTGYTSVLSADEAMKVGVDLFLEKPILRKTLAESVRKVLDNRHKGLE